MHAKHKRAPVMQLVERLLGAPVLMASGRPVGRVARVLIDPIDGRIRRLSVQPRTGSPFFVSDWQVEGLEALDEPVVTLK